MNAVWFVARGSKIRYHTLQMSYNVSTVRRNRRTLPTDRTSVSVMFQKAFQKCTSSSGSMAYLPEVKKELAATPGKRKTVDTVRRGCMGVSREYELKQRK
uniref:Uncharacterized protein n=1 Tax=Poecilia mexicana TaxID=48701 RepID=A0A3B3X4H8_9TELE